MRKVLKFLGIPLTYLSAMWLRFVKNDDGQSTEDKIFMKVGLLPITDHYYEPMINPKRDFKEDYSKDRVLTGINLNVADQLGYLTKLNYSHELVDVSIEKENENEYFYKNKNFEFVDADALYNVIRVEKPKRIIEIGAGYSSLIIQKAIHKNKMSGSATKHTCVEPYENKWLEKLDMELIRTPIEEIDLEELTSLEENDILFVDSSHMIRPSGDVLFIMQNIIPNLKKGVIIHIHDIFTPRHYPQKWVENHRFWNEQYLLEAFLAFNNDYEIMLAVNHLYQEQRGALTLTFPIIAKTSSINPGSFWMRKVQ